MRNIKSVVKLSFLCLITGLVLLNTAKLQTSEPITIKFDGDKEQITTLLNLIHANDKAINELKVDAIKKAEAISNLNYTPVDKMSANILVLNDGGTGSGSVIKVDESGSYILTAAHVVSTVVKYATPSSTHFDPKNVYENSKKVTVTLDRDGKEFAAIIVKIDYQQDLAVLKTIKKLKVNPITIAKKEPKIGEVVWGISNPGGAFGIINNGIFSTPEEEMSLVSIAGFFGSSGGMCLNNKGEQIGVISTVLTAEMNSFVQSLTVYMGITRTKDLNKFLKGIL
jgi:hypothetical protein